MSPLLRVAVPLLAAAVVAACSAAPPGSPPADPAVADLHERMGAVAEAQAQADRRLAAAVDAVRELDTIVAELRDPDRVDAARDRWPQAQAAWEGASTDGLREGLAALAAAVDRARASLDRVRDRVSGERWPAPYLDAEDEVLRRTRDYAETADELARALLASWPTYEGLHARTARFVEQRWFYRDAQEAADAYELAVQPLLEELAAGQRAIAVARERRDLAAREVNAAAGRARQVWDQRDRPAGDG